MHIPPVQIARHVNDEEALQAFYTARRFEGIEVDVHPADDWTVGDGRNGHRPALLHAFLGHVDALRGTNGRRERLKTIIEVKADRLTNEDADRLLDHCERYRNQIEIRFVSYSPDVVNTIFHATATRDEPIVCQVYIQEDDVTGHVQWSKRRRLGLPEEVGYHLRLHAFPPSKRPSYEEVMATGRRISTTGWNPLYRGWRNHDLSEVWNIKRL